MTMAIVPYDQDAMGKFYANRRVQMALGTSVVTMAYYALMLRRQIGRPGFRWGGFLAEAALTGALLGFLGPLLGETVFSKLLGGEQQGVGALPYGVPNYNMRRYGPQY